jgi:hypothetical protein
MRDTFLAMHCGVLDVFYTWVGTLDMRMSDVNMSAFGLMA